MLVHAIFCLIYLSEKKAERLKHMLIVLSLKNLILDVVMLNILIAIFFSAQVFNSITSKNACKYDMYEQVNVEKILNNTYDFEIVYEHYNR